MRANLKASDPLVIRIKPHLENLNVNLNILNQIQFNSISPWKLKKPNINLDLANQRKGVTHPNVYRQQYLDIRNQFPFHVPIFTDGSKVENSVTAAMVTGHQCYGIRIPKQCSIFSAEAHALLLSKILYKKSYNFYRL